MEKLPDENSKRFIAILNKKIETGRLMNALGHMTAGLAGGYEKTSEMNFLQYKDKSQGIHPNISHFPFIVLSAENSNQIRTVRMTANNEVSRCCPSTIKSLGGFCLLSTPICRESSSKAFCQKSK